MISALAVVLFIGLQGQGGPVDFGIREFQAALSQSNVRPSTAFRINRPGPSQKMRPESYRLKFINGAVEVEASDDNGALYGLLEAAERIRISGKDAWKQKVVEGKPFLADRGWNMFLPLPWDYEKNFVDNDPAALTDPNRWSFHNDDYWKTLLDMLARSRFNWLDIHGPYDLDTTRFPNLYAYFIQSEKFPEVGVAKDIKAKNLDRLRWIIKLAHARGIKVSLMSYEARFDVPHNPKPPYRGTEAEVYDYTKEVVEKMIRQVPELDKIGFRIGESGRGAEFFKCYTEAVEASGRNIPLYTRSWVTRKARVVPLARESDDFTVEIKYNGEQWGAPYIMSGGRTANWYSYWYEDYLSDSGAGKSERMWEGNEVGGKRLAVGGQGMPGTDFYFGGQKAEAGLRLNSRPTSQKPPTVSAWPSQPYKIVWQVRANGTHRIFPFYQPEWTRRSILSMKLGTASGYTIESTTSYFPQEPRFYWGGPPLPNKWNLDRDEMYIACWGRLGYDPSTPDSRFDAMLARKYGKEAGSRLAYAWKEASKVVPIAFMAYGLGPDHRSHAPELETGGGPYSYLEGEGFDSHVFMSAKEAIALRSTGGIDGRMRPEDAASALDFSRMLFSSFAARQNKDLAEYHAAIQQLKHLADYYSSQLRLGQVIALQEAGLLKADDPLLREVGPQSAYQAWQVYANSPEAQLYKPFTDRLRMHKHDFHWSQLTASLKGEADALTSLIPAPNAPSLKRGKPTVPQPPTENIQVQFNDSEVKVTVSAKGLKGAYLLEKPLPSATFFHKRLMVRGGGQYLQTFQREPWGHAVAVEVVDQKGHAFRLPWWQSHQPYVVVPSQQKPTPPIYSSEEALTFLKPEVLNPSKYGWLLVATRGEDFHRSFSRQTQRKLLAAVERGMNLLVMQQDLTSGRYPLDWLPIKPKVANRRESVFDPGGALGLEKFETRDAMWQPFEETAGWKVFGNGAVASLDHGKGKIWMVQGRLVQRMHVPGAARNLKRLLEACAPSALGAPGLAGANRNPSGERLPVVLVDAGSEGDLSSSAVPDFMNAHDIPFQTLGEVVAREQGMDSLTAVPGPISDDDVLGGKGKEIANKWLRDQVIAASKRPTPSSTDAFEKERSRRKAELMRCLGLDPMPARTPLNARITGEIQWDGYKIQKLVYESRPKFYVTAHLYLPDPLPAGKLPVIVHVNGHWAHKKGEDRLQLRSAFCAKQGYIALTIDSPGWSFEGNSLIERRPEGNHNDWFLVQGGTNATGYYVWDVMRGLDYLETRTDTDMARVGLTGASGGGLATLYAFAAEDRFKAAVPVVYMSSMELAPDNGCLCNHVPATCQVGDRSDVIAIQAPKPIYIFGAQDDPEFPPDAMRLTGKKMAETWKLLGKESDALTRIFAGPHDYNQLMREQMIGFFDKYLKGKGDGSPVPQAPIDILNPEDRSILVLDPVPTDERTMRDLSLEYLAQAPKEVTSDQVFAVNGGKPEVEPKNFKVTEGAGRHTVTFEAAPGLITPGIILPGRSLQAPLEIVLDDEGKAAAIVREPSASPPARLFLDILGTGELGGIELRYPVYLGRSPAMIGAMQIAGAAKLARVSGHSGPIEIRARGPLSSLAALYAALLDPSFAKVTSTKGLKEWSDVFKLGVTPYAVQPRAHLLGSLENLRKRVKNGSWEFAP